MTDSILENTKKILGIPADYDVFDLDVMIHINSALSTLTQLGIGPPEGYEIQDASNTWADFLGNDPRFNAVKSYVYLRVRLLFDPPTTGYHVEAVKEQIKELEWRLNTQREEEQWVSPPSRF
jgi:hypothetical protein